MINRHNRHNLIHIIFPIILSWKYSGLPIYRIDLKSQKIVTTNTKTFLIGLFILSLIIFLFVQDTYKNERLVSENYVDLLQCFTIFMHQLLIVVLSYKKRTEFAQIFSELILLDKMTSKLTIKKNSFYISIRNIILSITAVHYILVITCWVVDFLNFTGLELNTTLYYILSTIYYHNEILIIFYLITLRKEYQEFIDYLKFLKIVKVANYKIKKIFKLLLFLRKNFILIKTSFKEIILIKVLKDVIITSIGVFFILDTYRIENTGILFTTFSNILWLVSTLLTDFLLPVIFQDIFEKVSLIIICIIYYLPKINDNSISRTA